MQKSSLKIEGEEIVHADLTDRENLEVAAICKSGKIFLFDCQTNKRQFHSELPFDSYKLNLQIYSFMDYVCIVQKNGLDGIVINLSNSDFHKIITRKDYHADVSQFSIAFYKNDDNTFLIHATDWNRLDISNLESDELLTERIIEYETNSNYFDYFHGSLLMSPDFTKFISNGWVWQPYEVITLYSVIGFLKYYELSHTAITFEETSGYNWERPICWIDNRTLGISYNKKETGEIKGKIPSEIIFVDVLKNEITKRIEFSGFSHNEYGEVGGELFFDSENQQFIGLNKQSGLLICDSDGKEILKNSDLTLHKYFG